MALPDLTGQNIENTYQRVLQTDGTIIYDGTGSVFLPVSASYAVTASYAEYAVSASHEIIKEVSSSYADYAKESGLATSSISASYALTASYALNSPDVFPYTGSAVISGSLEVTGSIISNGNVTFGNPTSPTNLTIYTDTFGGGKYLQLKGAGTEPEITSNNSPIRIYAGSSYALQLGDYAYNYLGAAINIYGKGRASIFTTRAFNGGDWRLYQKENGQFHLNPGGTDFNLVQTIPDSVIFQVDSTDMGVRFPRHSTTSRDTISTPVEGLLIYNTSSQTFNYYNSSSWTEISKDPFPYTGSAVISGSLEVTGSTEIQYLTASGLNYPTTDGGEKQLIITDGNGNLSFDWSDRTNIDVKNTSGATLEIGTPVYISGFQGASVFQVSAASSSVPGTMPAIGILDQTLNDNGQGYATLLGAVRGIDTSTPGYSINQSLYVGEGILTPNRPTGSALIQKIARVGRVANNGEITVLGAGRSNDVPNLQPGYAWVGDNDWNAIATPTSSFSEDTFPYTGSAVISGSLTVTGSIFSTDTVTAVTGSFSHLKGNSPITIQDPVTFQHTQGLDVLGNATIHSINEVELQTISKDFNYTSSLAVAEITASVNGAIIDYRLTNLNSGSRVGTFMYAHDGTELSYNDLTIPGGGIGDQPILSASLVNDLVKIDIENAAGFNFTGYAKKFNKLANAIPVADPNINYLLNEYPSDNVVGAYSIRQLDQFYTGSAMRVREAGSNNEIDIEFDINGYLDTLAIAAHCSSNIGYVTIWYDQSGNNNHLTQSIAGNQPKIYDGSSIYEVNGQPCLRTRDASSDPVLEGPYGIDYTGGLSVYELINSAGYNSVSPSVAYQNGWAFRYGTIQSTFYVGNNAISLTSIGRTDSYQELFAGFYDNSTTTSYGFRKSGQFVPSFASGSTNATMPSTTEDQLVINKRGDYQELIIMNDYEISNREEIFTNINDYYNIYETGLLTDYPGAAAAYSVRQLTTAYTGSALRIREDGTNTETDIGFDSNGDLDTASITSHCGANNGLVVTWYDQSGNGNDATQSTVGNQPKIYDGTTGVVTDNGRVAISSTDTTSLEFTQITDINSVFSVLRPLYFSGGSKSFILGDVTNYDYHAGQGGQWLDSQYIDPVVKNGDNYLNGTSVNLTTLQRSAGQYLLSMIHTANTAVADSMSRDRTINGRSWIGKRQEVIIYPDDRTNDRTDIEDNINSYFNIY